jgi:GPH family glycoside/pentoside/hexuronide:cation symporter
MAPDRAKTSTLLAYGALGVPLAFAGLPVYVHVPKFYAEAIGMDLAMLGSVLLLIRLLDAFIDPLIGLMSDRLRRSRTRLMLCAAPLLLASYILLFTPPDWAQQHAMPWLVGCLALVYLAFSTLMINYYAMALDVARSYHDNTRAAMFREGAMLVGVLIASILPGVLLAHHSMRDAYGLFSLALLPLLATGLFVTLRSAPPPSATAADSHAPSFISLLADRPVRWVLLTGFCNAIPTAITSTLFLFFTGDVLHADAQSGLLLALYFLSAAIGMPFWSYASRRYGKRHALLLAMAISIICFIWAWRLGSGDLYPFAVICLLSGMTMGADVTLLPSMMADTLETKRSATATAFGLWNLCSKLTMAFAAGIALPLLAAGGYHPGAENNADALAQLSLCYALLPCLFKLVAMACLLISPLDKHHPTEMRSI